MSETNSGQSQENLFSRGESVNLDEDDIVQRQSTIAPPRKSQMNKVDNDSNNRRKHIDIYDNDQKQNQEGGFKKKLKELDYIKRAIGELYLYIKKKTRDENEILSEEEEKEEKEIILQLDSYVILEYIKSSIDIILNLKFEEIEKKLMVQNNDGYKSNQTIRKTSIRSQNYDDSQRSILSSQEGPPKIYEEMIQGLEADIRKHIRIEQQLKLHIETIECKDEELENKVYKLEEEINQLQKVKEDQKENKNKIQELQDSLNDKEDQLEKKVNELNQLKDKENKLNQELEQYKNQLKQRHDSQVFKTQDNNTQSKDVLFSKGGLNILKIQDDNGILSTFEQIRQGRTSKNSKSSKPSSQVMKNNEDANQSVFYSSVLERDSPKRITKTPEGNNPYKQKTPQIYSKKLSAVECDNKSNKARKKQVSQNQWVGSFPGSTDHSHSNIINNNIQGLSINYNNQIIQNVDTIPLQKFASNFIINARNQHDNDEDSKGSKDSNSSNQNSHRRCHSQNVQKGRKAKSSDVSKGKKSTGKKKYQFISETNDDFTTINERYNQGISGTDSIAEPVNLQFTYNNDKQQNNTNSQENRRRLVKKNLMGSQGQISSYTRTDNRNETIENGNKRKNQSICQKNSMVNSRNNNKLFQHLNSFSVDKNSRSRNKKIGNNQTSVLGSKFDHCAGVFDMQHFRTTMNSQLPKGNLSQNKTKQKQSNLNYNNMALIKQQLLGNKKQATNLIMKGLSPLKK